MTSSLALFDVALTADEAAALYLRLGVTGFVAPLGLRTRHVTVDVRDAALSRAADALTARGLVADGVVEPVVASALHAVHRPDRELAARLVGPAGGSRVSAIRRGPLTVLARLTTDGLSLRVLDGESGLAGVIGAVSSELPVARPAEVEPFGAPLAELAECLSGSADPRSLADRIRAAGASTRAAMSLGAVLGARQALVEITYAALHEHDGRILRAPAAAVVFYTARGRVVAAPSRSPAGDLWTTLKPGTDQVFGQAVRQLVELSTEGWGSGSAA